MLSRKSFHLVNPDSDRWGKFQLPERQTFMKESGVKWTAEQSREFQLPERQTFMKVK
jgi:hypothetical protein